MKVKKIISLLAGIAFIAAFAACPAFAASEETSGTYVAPPKDNNLTTGTLDYLGSVVDVTTKGTMEVLGAATTIPDTARRCPERATYRPVIVMNRGSRWVRVYKN